MPWSMHRVQQNFAGATCIVTGAASGIGRAVSRLLSQAGATVLMTDIDAEGVCFAADELDQLGGCCEGMALDVTDADAVAAAVRHAVSRGGKLDYMINNAGINVVGDFRDLDVDVWQRIVNVNLWGVVHGTRAAYDVMASQGFGHIVNMSSGLGITPGPRNVPYATTKFAVVGLSESIRIEAADLGIHVTVVCPGWIQTPMLEGRSVIQQPGASTGNSGRPLRIADAASSSVPFGFWDVDRAARVVLRGVARRRAIVVFPRYVHFFWWLYRFCRPLSDYWNRHEIRRFRELIGHDT